MGDDGKLDWIVNGDRAIEVDVAFSSCRRLLDLRFRVGRWPGERQIR